MSGCFLYLAILSQMGNATSLKGLAFTVRAQTGCQCRLGLWRVGQGRADGTQVLVLFSWGNV